MNREHWKAMLPFITAFANGERVEHRSTIHGQWSNSPSLYFTDPPEHYRRAPATRLRPWRMDEVPLGKKIRRKDGLSRCVLTSARRETMHCGMTIHSASGIPCDELLERWTMSDGSPCGVEEST